MDLRDRTKDRVTGESTAVENQRSFGSVIDDESST